MPTNLRPSIVPLNWPELVAEAVSRRKSEGLTQKDIAALAGVSVPTVIAFEKGETSLTLSKAMEILEIVGLLSEGRTLDLQEQFENEAERRWNDLVQSLPQRAPACMPRGAYVISYKIDGVALSTNDDLLDRLSRADKKYTGWPCFWLPTKKSLKAYPFDHGMECWLGKPDSEKMFEDPAHSDFWRVTRDGRFFMKRGYEEDSSETLEPGTIFDVTLPVWRVGEALLHAYNFAEAADVSPKNRLSFRVQYHGLSHRELKAWANPNITLFENQRASVDAVSQKISAEVGTIESRLVELVTEILNPLYRVFELFELPRATITSELSRLKANRRRLT